MIDRQKLAVWFQHANDKAASFDEAARRRILGEVALKANSDPKFREALSQRPEQVIEAEAKKLDLKPPPAAVKDMAKVARDISSAVPDAAGAEVKELVFRTIRDIEEAFRLTLLLTKILFGVGVVLIVVSLAVAVFMRQHEWTAAIFGAGGVVSLLVSTVLNTLDRVRNAAANLVQIQMAYLAYYKILHFLGPPPDTGAREDAIAYARELSSTTSQIMASVQAILTVARTTGDARDAPRKAPHANGRKGPDKKPARATGGNEKKGVKVRMVETG